MALSDISFLPFYNSKINNVIDDFYVPALSNCKTYKRVSAYFDSKILELYSAGIENIVKNYLKVYVNTKFFNIQSIKWF